MTSPETVYTWAPTTLVHEDDLVASLFDRTTAPAIRVWGDVLLELAAERSGIKTAPELTLRRRAIFGWRSSVPPLDALRIPTERTRIALTVDGSLCAVARHDIIDFVLDLGSWAGLRNCLVDKGYDPDMLAEELVPLTDALAPMRVEGARNAVEMTPPGLLGEVLNYFGESLANYATSWQTLSSVPNGGHVGGVWEVMVPREAVQSAAIGR